MANSDFGTWMGASSENDYFDNGLFIGGEVDPMFPVITDDDMLAEGLTFPEMTVEALVEMSQSMTRKELRNSFDISPRVKAVFTCVIWGQDFAKLPNEALTNIAECCTLDARVKLGKVSRCLNTVCTRALYNHVDLSIHNRGMVRPGENTNARYTHDYHLPQRSDSYWCMNVPSDIRPRQELFINELLSRPALTAMIKSFSWTLLLLHPKNSFHPNTGVDQTSPLWKIWDVLEQLRYVRTLDLAYLSGDHGHVLATQYPDALFPSATSVRLLGVFNYGLAWSILGKNSERLVHLTLDNLQQEGSYNDSFLFRHPPYQPARPSQVLSSWNVKPSQRKPAIYFLRRGPMQALLGSLAGRCTVLKSLTLRKVGERYFGDFSRRLTGITRSGKDEDLYMEHAAFIESLKPHLQHLTFEQGERGIPRAILRTERIMDERFRRLLLPTLVRGPWTKLESVTLGGVRIRGGAVGVPVTNVRQEDVVRVVVREDAGIMDHIGFTRTATQDG